MKKKFAWIAIPLVAVLCIGTYVFLSGDPDSLDTPAESESPPASSSDFPSPTATQNKSGVPTISPDDPPMERKSETKGDRTRFSLTHGDIGYVDVNSIMRDSNPYSIVDLLQKHDKFTGAYDSLEITIEGPYENEIWGQKVRFTQLIDGQPTNQGGSVFFSSNGAITRMYGSLVNTQSLNAGDILILSAEAEAITRHAAAEFIKPYVPGFNEELRLLGVNELVRAGPEDMDVFEPELRYILDSNNQLRAEWHIGVQAGFEPLRVRLAADTGEVVSIEMINAHATIQGVTFRLCDGDWAARSRPTCDGREEKSASDGTIYSNAEALANEAATFVGKFGDKQEFIRGVGRRGRIDILVNVPLHPRTAGSHNPYWASISLAPGHDYNRTTVGHEFFHAAFGNYTGDISHGLVYALDALFINPDNDFEWNSHVGNLTGRFAKIDQDEDAQIAGNVIYRIFKKVGKDKTAELTLRIGRENKPSNLAGLAEAMENFAPDLGISTEVNKVLVAVGLFGTDSQTQALEKRAKTEGVTDEILEGLRLYAYDFALEQNRPYKEVYNEILQNLILGLQDLQGLDDQDLEDNIIPWLPPGPWDDDDD